MHRIALYMALLAVVLLLICPTTMNAGPILSQSTGNAELATEPWTQRDTNLGVEIDAPIFNVSYDFLQPTDVESLLTDQSSKPDVAAQIPSGSLMRIFLNQPKSATNGSTRSVDPALLGVGTFVPSTLSSVRDRRPPQHELVFEPTSESEGGFLDWLFHDDDVGVWRIRQSSGK